MNVYESPSSDSDIKRPQYQVQHRDEEYEEGAFKTLFDMQERHFWYRGRHKFLLAAVNKYLSRSIKLLSAIDLGGGVGGWVTYLYSHRSDDISPLALADSSLVALKLSQSVLPPNVERYQVDLMNLQMNEQWDAAFLLDVIEHIPDDLNILRQAYVALKPGGYLFITAPAFNYFWSYNDDAVKHLRRYRREDFVRIAEQSGFILCYSRYFMFFLSPLYWLSRIRFNLLAMTLEQKKELMIKQHQIPISPVNKLLSAIFSLESPLGHWIKFPWGTSILVVLRRHE
jgi:SAM-dependent methyltransferase